MARNPQSGISQLELMVSLACMAFLAVGLANALDFSRQFLERNSKQTAETQYLLNRLQFRQWAADVPTMYSGKDAAHFFTGNETTLTMRTLASDGSFWAGEFALVELGVNNKGHLTLSAEGHLTREEMSQTTLTLDQGASKLKLSYYGRKANQPDKAWHTAWADPTFLPDLVKVEWQAADGHPAPPLTLLPGKRMREKHMELGTLVPVRR